MSQQMFKLLEVETKNNMEVCLPLPSPLSQSMFVSVSWEHVYRLCYILIKVTWAQAKPQ